MSQDTNAVARQWIAIGGSPIRIPRGEKNPGRKGWQDERVTLDNVDEHFPPGELSNLGSLHGGPSNGIVDVDIDHLEAVGLAPEILQDTPLKYGRRSKPQSHYYYRVTGSIESTPFKSKTDGTIVEIRSTGSQSVLPGSVHPSGEAVEAVAGIVEPAAITADELRHDVGLLYRATLCLLAIQKIDITDGKDGSRRLFAACCRCVEHDLPDEVAKLVIRHYEEQQPFPREYSNGDLIQRLRDAERKCQRGTATGTAKVPAKFMDPATEAEKIVSAADTHIIRHDGDFQSHANGYYGIMSADAVDGTIVRDLNAEFTNVTTTHVANVRLQLKTVCLLPDSVRPPVWINGEGPFPPDECLATRSKLIHLLTGQSCDATADFYCTAASPVAFDPAAPTPREWLSFLQSIWGDDAESIRLLQQWCGYLLTPNTQQQKMLLLVGPKRSGKGTIARVIRAVIGADSVAGPTLASLSGNFGLQPLIGKSLAIVSDARLSSRTDSAIVTERLLSISGEDALTIDRKNQDAVTVQLPTRIMLLTNETPRLADSSGALASRFLILKLKNSFYGREDTGLTARLSCELPGILNWAIAGWHDLREQGRFTIPAASTAAAQQLEELGSPVAKFVRECCAIEPDASVPKAVLYQAWADWCHADEHIRPTNASTFGSALDSVVPGLGDTRPVIDGKRVWHYCGVRLVAGPPRPADLPTHT